MADYWRFNLRNFFRDLWQKNYPSGNSRGSSPEVLDNHEKQDNYSFRQYVHDKTDIDGMIAYCLYKFEKVEAFDNAPTMTPEQKMETCRKLIEGRAYWQNKVESTEILKKLEQVIIGKHVIEKTWKKDFCVALMAGILSALLAPITWNYIEVSIENSKVTDIIRSSGGTAGSSEALGNSAKKP